MGAFGRRLPGSPSPNPWRRLARLFQKTSAAGAGSVAPATVQGEILDALNDWICTLDGEGRIILANLPFARDHGCSPDALTGTFFPGLVPPATRDAVLLALLRAATAHEPQTCHCETPMAGNDGSWCQWTFQRMPENRAPGVSVHRILATGRNVTEQKRLQHQFLQAQRVASIGLLASGIAHDLNNVLAPIVISADLLKMRGCSEENRALLDLVTTSAERGAGLVAQMLSFSRGIDGDREIVDLASLVKELGRFIGRTFPKSIQVRLEIAPDLWRLYANPTQVFQVLLNLCVNARDAMPRGGQLTLTAGNVTLDGPAADAIPGGAAGSYAVLGVSDTGTGIAPEIADRMFDPFFTTKAVGEGTGLGLSTVQSIVAACGGFVTFSTQIGRGTTFHAYFPVSGQASEVPATQPDLANARGNGEHVLVVDDEEFFCTVTRRLLEDFGYVVHVAGDGAEAVRVFKRHSADIAVAVVDLDMPVMNGCAAMRVFRAVNPQIRIIAVSGSGDAVAFAGGDRADLQLKKPYSMGTLLQALRQVLTGPAIA
jgi:PAS domain S-box-containing protein